MRKFIDSTVSRSASIVAGLILAVGVASVALGQYTVWGANRPVLLGEPTCADPSDARAWRDVRRECSAAGSSLGSFAARVLVPISAVDDFYFNRTGETCEPNEMLWACAGVGGSGCTPGLPVNHTWSSFDSTWASTNVTCVYVDTFLNVQ